MKPKVVSVEETGPIEVQWIVDFECYDPERRITETGSLMHQYADPTGNICQASVYIRGWMAEVPAEGEIFQLAMPPRPRPEDVELFARCESIVGPQLPYRQPVYWNNPLALIGGWQIRTLQDVETVDELLGLMGYLYLGYSREAGAYFDKDDYPLLISTLNGAMR